MSKSTTVVAGAVVAALLASGCGMQVPGVTVVDLLTAEAPYPYEGTRMVDGQVPGATMGYVSYEPGHPWSPVYLDMMGRGYQQALSVFVSGGVQMDPDRLMLTGLGGQLVDTLWLSDGGEAPYSDVQSMEPVGDSVRVTWVSHGAAGAGAVEHAGTVRYEDGRLTYTGD